MKPIWHFVKWLWSPVHRFWHRIKLFYLFTTFGLPWKEAWADSKNFQDTDEEISK